MTFVPQIPALLDPLNAALEGSGDDLTAILAVLIDDVTAAVPSFTGLYIAITAAAGYPITITTTDHAAVARASMLLPLHLISGLPAPSHIVFYAAQPGAFTDLAADTRNSYHLDGQIEIDRHLPPPDPDCTAAAAAIAAERRSAIDQAVGVLIDQGHPPEQAHR